jgi:S1-C subfamily serine protease
MTTFAPPGSNVRKPGMSIDLRMICRVSWAWLLFTSSARSDDGPVEAPRPEIASPTPEELRLLSASARRIAPRVFLVGHPEKGQSTGVLISKRDRLVATAAHVVDRSDEDKPDLAVADGSATPYRVEKVWFHPGIVRELDGGLSAVSDDPRDGSVDRFGPDVAVIRLADGGPELPEPCTLADDAVLRSMEGRAMGLLGYPLSMGRVWPTPERPAWATLAAGVFFRETRDIQRHVHFGRGQVHWTTALLKGGSSGGPAFLPDGQVVGIIVGGSVVPGGAYYSRCDRADLIREVLSYHQIGSHGPGVEAENPPLPSWTRDPRKTIVGLAPCATRSSARTQTTLMLILKGA